MAFLMSGQQCGDENRVHRRRPRGWLMLTTALAVLLMCPMAVRAQAPKEYQIKAVFLFNFVQFVEWPASAFVSPDDPIRIAVLGNDPFAGSLDIAVQGEKVRQRSLVVERVQRIQDAANCHLLFVCSSERMNIASIISAFKGRPVLTVGDMPDFARRGGIIDFYLEGQKVRFEINRAAALQSGLKVSSQLLGLARIVGPAVAER
jgi:hypothetical protein